MKTSPKVTVFKTVSLQRSTLLKALSSVSHLIVYPPGTRTRKKRTNAPQLSWTPRASPLSLLLSHRLLPPINMSEDRGQNVVTVVVKWGQFICEDVNFQPRVMLPLLRGRVCGGIQRQCWQLAGDY